MGNIMAIILFFSWVGSESGPSTRIRVLSPAKPLTSKHFIKKKLVKIKVRIISHTFLTLWHSLSYAFTILLLFLSHNLSSFLFLTQSLFLSFSHTISLPLFLSSTLSLSLSHSHTLSLPLFLSNTLYLSLTHTPSLFLTLSHTHPLSFSIFFNLLF